MSLEELKDIVGLFIKQGKMAFIEGATDKQMV